MSFIELEGMTRIATLPDESDLRILIGVDLEVEVGKHVSIVGRPGTGKSIMLNVIGMLDLPIAGRCTTDGIDVASLREGRRARLRGDAVGLIFQQSSTFNTHTALENVGVPLLYFNGARFWKRRELVTRMLECVGLDNRVDSHPTQMSGDEQQHIAIAHTLVHSPKIILANGLTGALDYDTGGSIMELLKTVTVESNAAPPVITYDPKVTERIDWVLELYGGTLHEGRVSLPSSESREVKT